MRAFARGCSVGTCRSRFGLPGCACRVETAWPWWNKVLRSSLYLTIARSGAGDRIVRFEFAGFGDLVRAPDLAVSCTGVLCRLLCAVARSRRMARWWLVAWRRGWCSACQQWVLVLDQRSLGCVPGRGTSLIRLCCGSFQSLCAMELLLVSVFSASVTCSGGHGVGGRQRWRWMFGKHKRSSGLVCNFPLLRGLLCKMLWTAVLLCLSGRCLYGSRSVLFYYGIIQVLCYQKKKREQKELSHPPAAVLSLRSLPGLFPTAGCVWY